MRNTNSRSYFIEQIICPRVANSAPDYLGIHAPVQQARPPTLSLNRKIRRVSSYLGYEYL